MELVRKVKKNEDGSYAADLVLTEGQMGFLLNFAVSELVLRGLATVKDEVEQ